ncbi:MAG TPA: GPW/gp25 family protein [Chthonomonadaceae bacterium]|nr:GPW/gp25 family protein [Chthonomonadaceae bacterium]
MLRDDYNFPFRIDAASNQAAQTSYPTHVDQMIRQLLLTDPGERIDMPTFGCGLRRMVFAPNSMALQATAQLLVSQQLQQWLGDQISNIKVQVLTPQPDPTQPDLDVQAVLLIQINYTLIETQTSASTQVQLI